MSISYNSCNDFIRHDALPSATDSAGNGSSMEEKIDALENVGDAKVTWGPVNKKNGGYTWTVQFLHDVDGPCQQKDEILGLCNSPGDVPKLCDPNSFTTCDESLLYGSCQKNENCSKITVLDASNFLNGIRPPRSNEIQILVTKDPTYAGWEDGSIVDLNGNISAYKLVVDEIETGCISHRASAGDLQSGIQDALDNGTGGLVQVKRLKILR